MTELEEQYPDLINEIMQHIESVKRRDKNKDFNSLIEIISDFAAKKDIEIDLVADAINSDVYFKSFIKKDCEVHGILETEDKSIDTW